MKQDEEINVCLDCGFEVEERGFGNEGLSVCSGCGNIEGDSEYITIEEYERRNEESDTQGEQ